MNNIHCRALPVLAIAFLFAGCATTTDVYLYREGGKVARADSDIFDCRLTAAQAVPQDTRIATTPIYMTPVQTSCYNVGNSVQCTSTGGQVHGGQTYTYDANADLRSSYLSRCVASKGYSSSQLPRCDPEKVPQNVVAELSGSQRVPQADSCYYPITENAGNVVHSGELAGG